MENIAVCFVRLETFSLLSFYFLLIERKSIICHNHRQGRHTPVTDTVTLPCGAKSNRGRKRLIWFMVPEDKSHEGSKYPEQEAEIIFPSTHRKQSEPKMRL